MTQILPRGYLPGMNGYDLLLKIREKANINIPAIVITGDTAPSQLTETEMDNCQLLHKPVVTDKLLELIWKVI